MTEAPCLRIRRPRSLTSSGSTRSIHLTSISSVAEREGVAGLIELPTLQEQCTIRLAFHDETICDVHQRGTAQLPSSSLRSLPGRASVLQVRTNGKRSTRALAPRERRRRHRDDIGRNDRLLLRRAWISQHYPAPLLTLLYPSRGDLRGNRRPAGTERLGSRHQAGNDSGR